MGVAWSEMRRTEELKRKVRTGMRENTKANESGLIEKELRKGKEEKRKEQEKEEKKRVHFSRQKIRKELRNKLDSLWVCK